MQTQKPTHKTKEELLKALFSSFNTGMRNFKSEHARKWMKSKGLNYDDVPVGFNSSQFHHRKSDSFKADYVRAGVLVKSDAAVRHKSMTAYTCFGGYSVVFPLKNQVGDIVNLFAIRINRPTEKTEYLNEEGLYPGYPHSLTQRLFIATDILSAATIMQSKTLENRDAILSMRDGEFQPQHFEAIGQLEHLMEIIFIK